MKILFVCSWNTCRSPMAEVIFKNLCYLKVKDKTVVRSAGTHAAGDMSLKAWDALKICGEIRPARRMKAVQFEPSMIKEFDYIICMTRKHAEYIGLQYKSVKTLDDFVGCGDIFDPYGHVLEVYVEVCKKLQKALSILYNTIFTTEGGIR